MDVEKATCYLTERYLTLYENQEYPSEAYKLNDGRYILPAIPFIGKEYFNQKPGQRILAYASAENLSGFANAEESLQSYCELNGMLRSRHNLDKQDKKFVETEEVIFPDIHIQPFTDGGLLIVVNRIMSNLFHEEYDELPRIFIERICCANYGKYTLMTEHVNKDYANDAEVLKIMQPYICADIEILQPDYIIMPKSMYYSGQGEFIKTLMNDIKGEHIFRIMQINPTNVNCHISNKYDKIPQLTNMEERWLSAISRINQEKFKSVYTYIDEVVVNRI